MTLASSCSVGSYLGEICGSEHRTFETLTHNEQVLIGLRIDAPQLNARDTICNVHERKFLTDYSFFHSKKCCDPFKCHKKVCKGGLRKIKIGGIYFEAGLHLGLIPGKSLCPSCRKRIIDEKKVQETQSGSETEGEEGDDYEYTDESFNKSKDREQVDKCFEAIDESPLRLHALPISGRKNLGKRKLESVFSAVKCKLANTLDVESQDLAIEDRQKNEADDKIKQFDRLVALVKAKIQEESSTRHKIQFLTLAPIDWSIPKVAETYGVTEYAVKRSRELLRERGILALPDKKKGKYLAQEVIEQVLAFYEDDEYSRIMPGKKDFVSVAKNVHKQKRLLLLNLQELFHVFKDSHPDIKISLSKFCELRPKWCVLAGASGTHSVCVCTHHQNMKLLLEPIDITYHELFGFIVCDQTKKDCMVHHCQNCPTDSSELASFLETVCVKKFGDKDVEFTQWVSTDRTNLFTQKETVADYVELVCAKLQDLTKHSYISKCQSQHLKNLKANLQPGTVIFTADFAENYQFVVQDEVQGFHWTNQQCSLHPAVIYYSENGEVKPKAFCVISDDLSHDVPFVYETQKLILGCLKDLDIQHVIYFSDGCAAQYKNLKNFKNLLHHAEDFGMDAKWIFFATSHGKGTCDGVGGTAKRLTAKKSLQKDCKDFILDARTMYEFCHNNIKGIEFIFLKSEQLEQTRLDLTHRFAESVTIPGTRSFHEFTPKEGYMIECKRCSEDNEPSLVFRYQSTAAARVDLSTLSVFQYVACVYDSKWYIGVLLNIDKEQKDCEVKFMQTVDTSQNRFKWPAQDDICWVPDTHLLKKINLPNTSTGRIYTLPEDEITAIKALYSEIAEL